MTDLVETELVVSCMNYNTMLQYIKEQHGDISYILDRYEHSDAFISDPNNWISWASAKRLLFLIKEFLNNYDPKLFYGIGLNMQRLRSVGALEQLIRLYPNPKSLVTRIPQFNKRFNHIFDMRVSNITQNSADLIVNYRGEFRETYIYDMCYWNQGIIASIPLLWDLPALRINETQCLFTIEEIIRDSYGHFSIDYKFLEDEFLVNGEKYAEIVYQGNTDYGKSYIATRDLIIDDIIILQKGIIYGAPYCWYKLSWENKGLLKNLNDMTLGRIINYLDSRKSLLEQLEYTERQFFEIQRLNKELQDYTKHLEDLVEERTTQLIEEEKKRHIYQVRAAQADAVARFLHQTSNLVLQPLASTMIVFEDFIEIIQDCKEEWVSDKSEDVLFQELDESLIRIHEVYPTASRVINGYRELFHAFYEIYVSTKSERNINQDLCYIETLVNNKYILTQVDLKLDLDPDVPPMKLEGGVQSIFLELMHNATNHGAKKIFVTSEFNVEKGFVKLRFYNDGEPIPDDQWNAKPMKSVNEKDRGFGLADARYIIESINNGKLYLAKPDMLDYYVLFVIELGTINE